MNTACDRPAPNETGERIRTLRRRRHLTQAELARRVGIRAGPMNNIEQGRNLPSLPVACAIAQVLDCALDDLFAPTAATTATLDAEPAQQRLCPLRPRELQPADWQRLVGLADAYLALEDLCGAPKQALIPLEMAYQITDPGLEDLARRVRTLFDIGQSVVFDYLELFENAGLRVMFCPLPDPLQSVGALEPANRNLFFFIRADLNPERQIFRLVYELGWVYLRNAEPAAEFSRDRAARRFAAFFLMPAPAVRQSVAQLGIQPDAWTYELLLRLKHRFGVSTESFIIRLEELNLIQTKIAQTTKARLRKHYTQQGYHEPDASRRILSPNGRLGDLLLNAQPNPEAQRIARQLKQLRIAT
ncbi:MAG: helix-turn-helix domain-containing protein [Candidatus Marinimicrobia bacterium]|nr:helix-turn-helix domain-containing protein [Candidatus Neomarinimicrobiota bacterium]